MIVNKNYNETAATMILQYIDGVITQTKPIRYKASHDKMRNLSPALRKLVIETLCPTEGYDQALLGGKHIPYSLLSERVLTRHRNYDKVIALKRKKSTVTCNN
jgi:hypothetical protein